MAQHSSYSQVGELFPFHQKRWSRKNIHHVNQHIYPNIFQVMILVLYHGFSIHISYECQGQNHGIIFVVHGHPTMGKKAIDARLDGAHVEWWWLATSARAALTLI